jgi:site-specific recombinase XerD
MPADGIISGFHGGSLLPEIQHHQLARTPTKLISNWLSYIELRLTPRTVCHYKMVIWRFAKFMPDDLSNLTVEHIERYLQSIEGINRTRNAHLTAIKSFGNYLDAHGMRNPAEKIKMLKEDPPKQRWLSVKDVEKILAACNGAEKKIILLFCHTGLRASELQGLNPNNINNGSIRLTGKGRKMRVIPLSATAKSVCNDNLNFLKSYRKRNALYAMCKRLSVKAGVQPVAGPHSFRRFFATSLINKGISIYHVSKLLGHADVRTTEIYLSCSGDELKGITNCLDK